MHPPYSASMVRRAVLMPQRLRTAPLLLAVLASTAALAAPAPSQAAPGWRCSAEALTGSVLGQSIPGVVRTGSTTEDCKTGQAVQPLSLPPLLDVGTLAASTTAAPKSVV